MAKLSEVQAIEHTLKMWRDMEKTGEKFSHNWKGWKKNGGRFNNCWNDCFLCEYTWMQMGRHTCTSCPYLKKFERNCEDSSSPYSDWLDASTEEERKVAAQKCVEVLEQLLEEAKSAESR